MPQRAKAVLLAIGSEAMLRQLNRDSSLLKGWNVVASVSLPKTWARADAVVVDLDSLGKDKADFLRELATDPSVPVLLSGPLNARIVKDVLGLAPDRVVEVVMPTDSPSFIVKRSAIDAVPQRVIRLLMKRTRTLDNHTRKALRQVLTEPERFPRVKDIAEAAHISTRTLYRYLEGVGIAQPKDLIRAGRILKTIPHLYNRQRTIKEVATEAGFSAYYDYQFTVKRLLGASPRDIRYHVNPAKLAERLVHSLTSATPTAASGRSGRKNKDS